MSLMALMKGPFYFNLYELTCRSVLRIFGGSVEGADGDGYLKHRPWLR